MRIQKLDSHTRRNLLEDLLKRSPNQYGSYEEGVARILEDVKTKATQPCLSTLRNSTMRISMSRTSA